MTVNPATPDKWIISQMSNGKKMLDFFKKGVIIVIQ